MCCTPCHLHPNPALAKIPVKWLWRFSERANGQRGVFSQRIFQGNNKAETKPFESSALFLSPGVRRQKWKRISKVGSGCPSMPEVAAIRNQGWRLQDRYYTTSTGSHTPCSFPQPGSFLHFPAGYLPSLSAKMPYKSLPIMPGTPCISYSPPPLPMPRGSKLLLCPHSKIQDPPIPLFFLSLFCSAGKSLRASPQGDGGLHYAGSC